ncbi:MAG: hypothetical protein U0Y68_14380 [Blastocatellia bacterium]
MVSRKLGRSRFGRIDECFLTSCSGGFIIHCSATSGAQQRSWDEWDDDDFNDFRIREDALRPCRMRFARRWLGLLDQEQYEQLFDEFGRARNEQLEKLVDN